MNILFLTSAAPAKSGFSTSEKRPPLGVGYLIAVLKRQGHKVFFSDEYLSPSNILESDYLTRNRIDVVGIYSNTVCYQSTLDMFRKIQLKREKHEWNGRIIVGGPHTSVGSDEIPGYVDHVVIGEGEITLPKIIKGDIKERIVRGEFVSDLDSLPMPAWEEFIYRNYCWSDSWLDVYPVYTMNTSRGCPFDCTFCSVKAIWGKTYRSMSAARVVDDVLYMKKYYGAKGIFFREDHFTLSKKRTVEFCELMLRKNVGVQWSCEIRADQLDDYEYVKLMADAGCKAFYIGVESGSPRMLTMYKKGETVGQFIDAFANAKKAGIKTYASFVMGVPYETSEDDQMTEKLIDTIKPDFVGRNVFVGIPGSALAEQIKSDGLYDYEDENHILYPKGYLSNAYKYYGENDYFKVYDINYPRKLLFSGSKKIIKGMYLSEVGVVKINDFKYKVDFLFDVTAKIKRNHIIFFHGSVRNEDSEKLRIDRRIHGFENWDLNTKVSMTDWEIGSVTESNMINTSDCAYELKMGLYDKTIDKSVGNIVSLGTVNFKEFDFDEHD